MHLAFDFTHLEVVEKANGLSTSIETGVSHSTLTVAIAQT